jgi:hypothetical protein
MAIYSRDGAMAGDDPQACLPLQVWGSGAGRSHRPCCFLSNWVPSGERGEHSAGGVRIDVRGTSVGDCGSGWDGGWEGGEAVDGPKLLHACGAGFGCWCMGVGSRFWWGLQPIFCEFIELMSAIWIGDYCSLHDV